MKKICIEKEKYFRIIDIKNLEKKITGRRSFWKKTC